MGCNRRHEPRSQRAVQLRADDRRVVGRPNVPGAGTGHIRSREQRDGRTGGGDRLAVLERLAHEVDGVRFPEPGAGVGTIGNQHPVEEDRRYRQDREGRRATRAYHPDT